MEYAGTAHNRTVYASPPLAARLRLCRVIPLRFIPAQNLRHSLPTMEMLRIFLSGPPNRHKQPGRYAK
jgi:hypothetical protein